MRGYLPANETRRISMAEKRDNVAVKYKDNVFCMLYRDKKNLLELYNALNNSNYINVNDLKVTTLNGGSYMKYKNDASFLLSMNLYMFEQQSSRNNNMALRFLHYVSDVFRELFSNDMLHRRSMIKIPVPHFVTFYNGLEKWVDEEAEIKLSDMYEIPVDNPQLELKVRVININKDADILSKCKTLRDYMTFVNKVRYKTAAEREDVTLAVLEAMDECIEENILVDFFEQHREEVVEVSIYDYDEEKVRKTLVDEAVEEIVGKAVEEAVKEAVDEAIRETSQLNMINLIIKKVKKEKTLETIASELEENVEDIKVLYDMVKEAAPEYDVDKIMKKLNNEND